MKKKQLVPRNIKFDEELLAEANKKGLNVADISRHAIETALKKKRCPCCNQILKQN